MIRGGDFIIIFVSGIWLLIKLIVFLWCCIGILEMFGIMLFDIVFCYRIEIVFINNDLDSINGWIYKSCVNIFCGVIIIFFVLLLGLLVKGLELDFCNKYLFLFFFVVFIFRSWSEMEDWFFNVIIKMLDFFKVSVVVGIWFFMVLVFKFLSKSEFFLKGVM